MVYIRGNPVETGFPLVQGLRQALLESRHKSREVRVNLWLCFPLLTVSPGLPGFLTEARNWMNNYLFEGIVWSTKPFAHTLLGFSLVKRSGSSTGRRTQEQRRIEIAYLSTPHMTALLAISSGPSTLTQSTKIILKCLG